MENQTFQNLIPKFADHLEFDLGLAKETVSKYNSNMHGISRDIQEVQHPSDLTLESVTMLKKVMKLRGAGESRINNVLFTLRKFLTFCNTIQKITTINPKDIKPMKTPKREVTYLTKEETNKLLDSIDPNDIRGLRMKALMEVLLATGMRISEALSLNRSDINWTDSEILIVGKGNKQRSVFLTPRAIGWLKKYLEKRVDENPALFVTFGEGKRLTRYDLSKLFKRYAQRAGIHKKVTPHILRHTMATTMLHNGGDITFIKELLGHSNIETTAQYYLGTDKRAVKEAHAKYLKFD